MTRVSGNRSRKSDLAIAARLGVCILSFGLFEPGCGSDSPQVVQRSSVAAVSDSSAGSSDPVAGHFDRRLTVVASETAGPLDANRVARSVGEALQAHGLNVADPSEQSRRDLIVHLRYGVREGSIWGGIPSSEVLLEYRLFDTRQEEPLAHGEELGRFADRSTEKAVMGALRQCVRRLFPRIVRELALLPEALGAPPGIEEVASVAEASLACLPFRNATSRAELDGWCETLASVAAEAYQQTGRYRLRERARLRQIVDDQDVTAVLGGQADAARRIGSELGAEWLLVGEVAVRPDGALAVSARLVRVETAEVEHIVIVADRADQAERLEAEFRRRLRRPTMGWIAERSEAIERTPLAWPEDAPARR